jgi:2-oxo-4-hydroxy-4-carboxy--5-ureidoimidazoline (OHCU) decarboxylase
MEKGQRALAAQLWSSEKRKEMANTHPDLAWLFSGKKKKRGRRTQTRNENRAEAALGEMALED